MGLTEILQGSGIKVHIDKKKVKQSAKEPVNRLESVCAYLDRQIDILEKQGNLDPTYNVIKEGKRAGKKIKAINAWSAVDDEGKREIVLMCKNKKMYINEAAAKSDNRIFIDAKDDNYENVLGYLKDIRQKIGKMELEDFNPWTRIKDDKEVKKIK